MCQECSSLANCSLIGLTYARLLFNHLNIDYFEFMYIFPTADRYSFSRCSIHNIIRRDSSSFHGL
jgi:hypothetical protein